MYIHNVYADRALVDMTAAQSVDFESIKLKLSLAVMRYRRLIHPLAFSSLQLLTRNNLYLLIFIKFECVFAYYRIIILLCMDPV